MPKTPTRKQREARDKKIHAEYCRLKAMPGAMATACELIIMKKFKVSRSTIYNINKRLLATAH